MMPHTFQGRKALTSTLSHILGHGEEVESLLAIFPVGATHFIDDD